jgi:hypothetical protein
VFEIVDERLAVTILNDVLLLYVMTYFQHEFFANNVDKNNRNKQNFDRINHQQLFCIKNKIDIVNVVRFEDVLKSAVFEHQLKHQQNKFLYKLKFLIYQKLLKQHEENLNYYQM